MPAAGHALDCLSPSFLPRANARAAEGAYTHQPRERKRGRERPQKTFGGRRKAQPFFLHRLMLPFFSLASFLLHRTATDEGRMQRKAAVAKL